MTWQSEVRAWAVASAAAFCLSAIGARVLTAPPFPDLNPTVKHIDAATGAWAAASAQQVASVAAIERDLRVELWNVDRVINTGGETLTAAQGAIDTLNGQLTHVAPLLDAATVTVASIPPAVKLVTDDADAVAKGVLPTEAAVNRSIDDFDAALKSPNLTRIEANFADMTDTGKHIMLTTDQVESKLTQCTLHPTIKCALKSDILFGAQVGGYLLK